MTPKSSYDDTDCEAYPFIKSASQREHKNSKNLKTSLPIVSQCCNKKSLKSQLDGSQPLNLIELGSGQHDDEVFLCDDMSSLTTNLEENQNHTNNGNNFGHSNGHLHHIGNNYKKNRSRGQSGFGGILKRVKRLSIF